ncbi:MAG: hypothetical protein OQK32_01515, partial [Gammaproteobacteria bacterium]|nr:hypothetical protein [Gammaproteobacteria bacterium]
MINRVLFFCFIVMAFSGHAVSTDNLVLGIFNNEQCLQCHEKTDGDLIGGWRNSAHASSEPVIDCVACHGTEHESVAARARQD